MQRLGRVGVHGLSLYRAIPAAYTHLWSEFVGLGQGPRAVGQILPVCVCVVGG